MTDLASHFRRITQHLRYSMSSAFFSGTLFVFLLFLEIWDWCNDSFPPPHTCTHTAWWNASTAEGNGMWAEQLEAGWGDGMEEKRGGGRKVTQMSFLIRRKRSHDFVLSVDSLYPQRLCHVSPSVDLTFKTPYVVKGPVYCLYIQIFCVRPAEMMLLIHYFTEKW